MGDEPDILINRYTTRQDGQISSLAQAGFATFGKGVHLVCGVPLFHLFHLTSDCELEKELTYITPRSINNSIHAQHCFGPFFRITRE